MSVLPRGSEWRKWDLHVHGPGTKLGDQYKTIDGTTEIDKFCRAIHQSDVAVIGITDYFSFDAYFAVEKRYAELYGSDQKLLLPNMELRLPVSVNKASQAVNLHLIFNPSTLSQKVAETFLSNLKTEGTQGHNRTRISCADLSTSHEYESASVSLASIDEAVSDTFGELAVSPNARQEHLLVVASAKGDGIRAGGSGIKRKNLISDEIDKYCDAFFSNAGSRQYFLDRDRLEGDDKVVPKPVFDGCDSHSFEDLQRDLGQAHAADGRHRGITWVKADPSFSGLLQTLIEPADRVLIDSVRPDQKAPYRVISKVRFSGTQDFPDELTFNQNLCSLIGSRSSGKSALLAHIAHAVDPESTITIQADAQNLKDRSEAGPAAGFTWDDVATTKCEVEWASGDGTTGKTIYIPQNSLYRLSEQPGEITKKISPALYRKHPTIKVAHETAMSEIDLANAGVREQVSEWFSLAARIEVAQKETTDLGDKVAVAQERDRLQKEIDEIKQKSELTDEEVYSYQQISGRLGENTARIGAIGTESERLASYLVFGEDGTEPGIVQDSVQVNVSIRPAASELSPAIAARIAKIQSDASYEVSQRVEAELLAIGAELVSERQELAASSDKIKDDNGVLIEKHEANRELSVVVEKHKKHVARIREIEENEEHQLELLQGQEKCVERLASFLRDRHTALAGFLKAFESEPRMLDELTLSVEAQVSDDLIREVTTGFSQRKLSAYIESKGSLVLYEKAQANPAVFLAALNTKDVSLNKGYSPRDVATEVLTVTEEIRFSAELDSDRIGGFTRSSMTPGKQALFALTLILNESQESWPLLIDQPEDDLDSRSIYEVIVPYLVERKKERQIIMVTHNANLVIGADSEQVIVANRHGDDRKNADGRMFQYLCGALEHTQDVDETSPTALGRFGIREHSCEILDGGEEAFEKRRNKYKILSQ
ncbi:TrlF family AAA-like ATPase [Changpingibacter yushuensis]|uniref:TrlF family AAA-like ATPase n=1 Tax=Changpingibacter yushuensis TaxID=2758440 RepID=UPI00165D8904|nr:ATP-binding protein [Changpingibacter yushuensis]